MRLTRLAVVGLLLLPIIEIVVIVAVGQAIGGWPTFLLLVATSLLGAWLIRREGGRAWRALEQAVRSGRMPAREIADGVVVLVGGSLLLLPGFVTDVSASLLVLPFTRPVARSLLAAVISRRLLAQTERFTGPTVAGQPSAPDVGAAGDARRARSGRRRATRSSRARSSTRTEPSPGSAAGSASFEPIAAPVSRPRRADGDTRDLRHTARRSRGTQKARLHERGGLLGGAVGEGQAVLRRRGFSPRDSRSSVRRSSRSSSSSGMERRSRSMSQCVRWCLTGLASGSGRHPAASRRGRSGTPTSRARRPRSRRGARCGDLPGRRRR